MRDKPHRSWFQLHLSTAIVMMFVAGGVTWANFSPESGGHFEFVPIPPQQGMMFPVLPTRTSYGWPYRCFDLYGEEHRFWSYSRLGIDGALALIILCGSAIICEYFLRRREARKP